jgi:hypothetical protein
MKSAYLLLHLNWMLSATQNAPEHHSRLRLVRQLRK